MRQGTKNRHRLNRKRGESVQGKKETGRSERKKTFRERIKTGIERQRDGERRVVRMAEC